MELKPPERDGFRSGLYVGRVLHHRSWPRVHRFEYRVWQLYLDLDELAALDRAVHRFGVNRSARISFHERDHLPLGGMNVRENLDRFLRTQGEGLRDDDRVRLLAFPRVLNQVFNPVSYWFVLDAAERPRLAVAEVHNTFGEAKAFLVPHVGGDTFRARMPKQFYVSPFSDLDTEFDFHLRLPGPNLRIGVDDYRGGKRILTSRLWGRRRPLNAAELSRTFWRHPWLTATVIGGIHWQALRLYMKGLPWYRKAARPDLQRDLLSPANPKKEVLS